MKIKVTYDKEDILKLVQKDLLSNGLKHDLSTAVYKGTATVTIEVEGTPSEDEAPVETPVPVEAAPAPVAKAPVTKPAPPTPPHEEPTTEEPVGDMSAILAASRKNANETKPYYPAGHTMMEGESAEWPGVPEQRNR